MNKKLTLTMLTLVSMCISSCSQHPESKHFSRKREGEKIPAWLSEVDQEVHKLGSYNWIVISDPAFPSFSRTGVTTVTVPVSSTTALDAVFQSIDSTGHVRPKVYITKESRFLNETETPGISSFRKTLNKALHGREARAIDNLALELLLNDAKKKYEILVIKTNTLLPYSSVFIELENGYWDGKTETSLRKRMLR